MIVADLADSPEMGSGGFSNPREVYAHMQARQLVAGGPGIGGSLLNPAYATRRTRGDRAAVYAAQREQTEAQRQAGIGLVVEGSANLPDRVTRH